MNSPRFAIFAALLALSACSGPPPAAPTSSSEAPAASSEAAPAAPAETAPPADNAAIEPLFGKWAVDLSQCNNAGAGPITISATRFEGSENGCDINGFTDNGNGSFTAALTCTAQGQTATESISMRPIFAPTGEGIDMVYLDRDNQAFTVLRCAEGNAN